MMKRIKQETYDEWIKGRACKSCAIFKPDSFCFTLEWCQASDAQKSDVAQFYLVHRLSESNPDGKPQDIGVKFKGDRQRKLAVNPKKPELIIAAGGRNIFFQDDQGGKSENQLERKDIPVTTSTKYIGNHFYVVGLNRSVLRREGPNLWTNLSRDIQEDSTEIGFEDIDGFDDNDLYAVGFNGDAWHYNGEKWSQLDLPTNISLYSVCCASDGHVYIGGNCHIVIKGRGEKWEVIHKDDSWRSCKQIVDYQGRLLTVDEWGGQIFEIKSDSFATMETDGFDFLAASCLCLASGHGMLLVAGTGSAVVYDGQNWHRLFSRGMGVSDEDLLRGMAEDVSQSLKRTKDLLEDLD